MRVQAAGAEHQRMARLHRRHQNQPVIVGLGGKSKAVHDLDLFSYRVTKMDLVADAGVQTGARPVSGKISLLHLSPIRHHAHFVDAADLE